MARQTPISEERIRERAYRLWLEDGQPRGRSAEHWQRARKLLIREADPEAGEAGFVGGGETKVPRKRRPSVTRKPERRPM